MQHKRNTNKKYKERYIRTKHYLHSIPTLLLFINIIMMKKNVKSNVLYSIPNKVASALFLVVSILSLIQHESVYAATGCNAYPVTDSGTISPLPDAPPITHDAIISMQLSKPVMVSDTVVAGETAVVSTDVSVSVSSAANYSLTMSMDKTVLQNGSTSITPGNAIADNTWGYKWDNSTSYTAPSTTNTSLSVPTLVNNATNFTKTLTFAAKFGENAEAGHYNASGTLSLTANPKITTSLSLANISEMQQITPEICENTPYLSGQNYSAEYTLKDVRDNQTYTVRRLGDGRCWMTQNLRIDGGGSCSGRELTTTTSDVATTWYLPMSNVSSFNGSSASSVYLSSSSGYYTWCAATAGCKTASGTSPSAEENAASSICPKGWKLPSGGANPSASEFGKLTSAGDISNTAAGSTKIRNMPYNFAYTGYVGNGTFYDPSSYQAGYYWSSTASGNSTAYDLYISSVAVGPGSYNHYVGFAVRCIARNS